MSTRKLSLLILTLILTFLVGFSTGTMIDPKSTVLKNSKGEVKKDIYREARQIIDADNVVKITNYVEQDPQPQ